MTASRFKSNDYAPFPLRDDDLKCPSFQIRDSKRGRRGVVGGPQDGNVDQYRGSGSSRIAASSSSSHQNLMTPSTSATLDWYNSANRGEVEASAVPRQFPSHYSNLTLASFISGDSSSRRHRAGGGGGGGKAPSSILTGSLGHFLRWRKSSAEGENGRGRRRRRKRLSEEAEAIGTATTWLYDQVRIR